MAAKSCNWVQILYARWQAVRKVTCCTRVGSRKDGQRTCSCWSAYMRSCSSRLTCIEVLVTALLGSAACTVGVDIYSEKDSPFPLLFLFFIFPPWCLCVPCPPCLYSRTRMTDELGLGIWCLVCMYVPFFFSFRFFPFSWLLGMLFDCVILHTSQTLFFLTFTHTYSKDTDTDGGTWR